MACSHGRHGQDEKFSLVRVGGVNKLLVANRKLGGYDTKLIETRSFKTVLSAVCEHNWRQDN